MFKLSRQQLDVLLQQNETTFVAIIVEHIHNEMPDEVRGIPQHIIWSMVEVGISRARFYGMLTDEQVIAYVAIMFEIAPNFDEEPALHQILTDVALSAEQRWSKLFSDPDLYSSWERAALPSKYDASAWFEPVPRG
jgi:hypothetical protein